MAANHQLDQVTASSPSVVPHRKSHFGFLALLILLGIALAAGIVFELTQRKTQEKTLAATIAEDANRPPAVNVGRVRAASSSSTVELPGQTVALVETPIYARADGYLKQRPVGLRDPHVGASGHAIRVERRSDERRSVVVLLPAHE